MSTSTTTSKLPEDEENIQSSRESNRSLNISSRQEIVLFSYAISATTTTKPKPMLKLSRQISRENGNKLSR